MDFLDYRDPRPIYEQIADRYRTLILKNVLSPGEQMPSVRSLAIELSTNPNTVQKAYTELERQGYIYTVKGKGNYVSGGDQLMENKKSELAERVAQLLREADDLGVDRTELLNMAEEKLGSDSGKRGERLT